MPSLSIQQRADIKAEVMRELSRLRIGTGDMVKSQVDAVIASMDDALDAAEIASVTSLSAGPAKTWLIANQAAGRELMILIEKTRREVL